MEKHKCNLCLRNFSNGRALGGHMRSHTMNQQYVPPKPKKQYQYEEEEEEEEEEKNDHQLSEEMESRPSSSSEEEDEEEGGGRGGGGGIEIRNRGLIMCKGFREKRRKRNYLLDPEFSSAVDATAGSVVLQDRESETESSKKSICRRSKRIRTSRISDTRGFSGYNKTEAQPEPQPHVEKHGKSPIGSPLVEHEPVSSISDTTPEEDVAYCLMMLSRDKWNEQEEEEEEEEESEQEKAKETKKDGGFHDPGGAINNIKVTKTRNRGKFRCETCNKVFRSYQALGGHRASHKRTKVNIKSSAAAQESAMAVSGNAACTVVEEKIHECPVCYRVFSSGQALGGHKRSHFIGGAATAAAAANINSIPSKPFSRFGETLIDLNLPAPMDDEDDDDISQIELSAVSDAEFDNPIIRSDSKLIKI